MVRAELLAEEPVRAQLHATPADLVGANSSTVRALRSRARSRSLDEHAATATATTPRLVEIGGRFARPRRASRGGGGDGAPTGRDRRRADREKDPPEAGRGRHRSDPRQVSKEGFTVVLTSRDRKAGKEAVDALRQEGLDVHY